MESRSSPTIKIHAVQRYLFWKYFQPLIRNIRVCEFPKSGGTWLSQMLADLLELPYPRNTHLPLVPCVQHEHFTGPTKFKTILLIRDGRDIMVSAYFHFLIAEHNRPPQLLKKWRRLMGDQNLENVAYHLPKFIKVFNENYTVGGLQTSWADHFSSYQTSTEELLIVKYEELLLDAETELKKILEWYKVESKKSYSEVIQKYSFENQSRRARGNQDAQSFLRKGISGDWKNYFNKEATELFNNSSLDTLRQMGYEK